MVGEPGPDGVGRTEMVLQARLRKQSYCRSYYIVLQADGYADKYFIEVDLQFHLTCFTNKNATSCTGSGIFFTPNGILINALFTPLFL